MRNDRLGSVRAPAIALLVTGCLNGAIGLLTLASGLLRLTGLTGHETLPTDRAERTGFLAATIGSYSLALISLLFAPVIIYGAVQMMNAKNLGLAKIAAVLSIVPITSCCFLMGIPIGIWSLVVLRRPETRAVFDGD